MIHYTLLPAEEMKYLRTEYRIRLFIVTLFFLSCAVTMGIITLLPSYMISGSQETIALDQANKLKKGQEASGAAQAAKDLAVSQAIASKIIADQDNFTYSDIIQRILFHRSKNIFINSFESSNSVDETGTTTSIQTIIQGKAVTREELISFKKSLEDDKFFLKAELPISDLAKNKDISFSLRLTTLIPKAVVKIK